MLIKYEYTRRLRINIKIEVGNVILGKRNIRIKIDRD